MAVTDTSIHPRVKLGGAKRNTCAPGVKDHGVLKRVRTRLDARMKDWNASISGAKGKKGVPECWRKPGSMNPNRT